MLLPFDKTERQNPVACNCQYDDVSDCPNVGCAHFCEEMAEKHPQQFRDQYLKWGYTVRENIQGEFDFTEEYRPIIPDGFPPQDPKSWKTYRCRRCLMMTHAENINNKQFVAIISNVAQDVKRFKQQHRDMPPIEEVQAVPTDSEEETGSEDKDKEKKDGDEKDDDDDDDASSKDDEKTEKSEIVEKSDKSEKGDKDKEKKSSDRLSVDEKDGKSSTKNSARGDKKESSSRPESARNSARGEKDKGEKEKDIHASGDKKEKDASAAASSSDASPAK